MAKKRQRPAGAKHLALVVPSIETPRSFAAGVAEALFRQARRIRLSRRGDLYIAQRLEERARWKLEEDDQ